MPVKSCGIYMQSWKRRMSGALYFTEPATWLKSPIYLCSNPALNWWRWLMMAAMAGANYITCVGTLESTLAGGHELAVIDNDLIGMVKRALNGIEVTDDNLALDVIKRGVRHSNWSHALKMLEQTKEYGHLELICLIVIDSEFVQKYCQRQLNK